MEYLSVADARDRDDLRLVLTAGNPGPWGEAAKAIFKVKGVPFTAVRQDAGGDNAALRDWTGHRNAPVVVAGSQAMSTSEAGGEPPHSHWLDILQFAERLCPEPALIPAVMGDRIAMLGMIHELAGYRGLGWYRRLLIFHPLMNDPDYAEMMRNMAHDYGYSPAEAEIAEARCVEVLALLSEQLRQQQARGSRYFFGDTVSALDLYWAAFSNMVQPLAEADCSMAAGTRAAYGQLPGAVAAAADPLLFQHRDWIWREVIGLPMDF